MRTPWKVAVIGGEVTMLVAFTGIGLHLAIQPHRTAFHPPALVLPTRAASTVPRLTPAASRQPAPPSSPAPSPAASPTPLLAGLITRFGHNDHNLLVNQWDIIQRLTAVVEHYLQDKLRSAPGSPR